MLVSSCTSGNRRDHKKPAKAGKESRRHCSRIREREEEEDGKEGPEKTGDAEERRLSRASEENEPEKLILARVDS